MSFSISYYSTTVQKVQNSVLFICSYTFCWIRNYNSGSGSRLKFRIHADLDPYLTLLKRHIKVPVRNILVYRYTVYTICVKVKMLYKFYPNRSGGSGSRLIGTSTLPPSPKPCLTVVIFSKKRRSNIYKVLESRLFVQIYFQCCRARAAPPPLRAEVPYRYRVPVFE